MRFTWDETKRKLNTKAHGLDFVDAKQVFSGPTVTFEDNRFAYTEQRFITLGFLYGESVSLAHTETEYEIHCISFRKTTRREEKILFEGIKN
jgi:uncharacterized protein